MIKKGLFAILLVGIGIGIGKFVLTSKEKQSVAPSFLVTMLLAKLLAQKQRWVKQ